MIRNEKVNGANELMQLLCGSKQYIIYHLNRILNNKGIRTPGFTTFNIMLKKTKGLCFLCGLDLLAEDRFEIHQRISPQKIKSFDMKYIIPLCINCHRRAIRAKLSKDKTDYHTLIKLEVLLPEDLD